MQNYDGSSPSKYRTWKEEAERFAATIRNADPEDFRYICRKTLTGPAGREYRRYIEQNDTATWQEIKDHLGEKYDDPDRGRSALTQIFNLQQRPHELVQGFAERLQTLAESAYTPAQRGQSAVDLQLVTIFTNGLTDDYIVRRLLEGAPANLEDAVELAMTLQNGSRTVEFNKHHFRHHRQAPEYYPPDNRDIEPMDYMSMMRQQSAQMEGKIDSLTNNIQQLVGAMSKDLKHKKEHKKETEPKAPVAAQAPVSGCQANFQSQPEYQPPPPPHGYQGYNNHQGYQGQQQYQQGYNQGYPYQQGYNPNYGGAPRGQQQYQQQQQQRRQPNARGYVNSQGVFVAYEFTPSGQPICDYCKNIGHIKRRCLIKQRDQQRQPGQFPPQHHQGNQ